MSWREHAASRVPGCQGKTVSDAVFRLPEQKPPNVESFDARPRRVKAWLESLPMASSGEAVRQLFPAIREVNRLRLPAGDRFKVLEMWRAPVRELCASLERHYLGRDFPIPRRSATVARLVREFHAEMALGYKLLVRDWSAPVGTAVLLQRRALDTALHRALRYQGLTLLRCYQVYADPPQGAWREMHHLYDLARTHRVAERVVDDAAEVPARATIEALYKQALMLSLAGPYRLRQGEVPRVHETLGDWVEDCVLSDYRRQRPSAGLFAVLADSDRPPLALQQVEDPRRVRWVLDTAPLTRRLRVGVARRALAQGQQAGVQVAGAPAGGGEQGLHADLARRLLLAWGASLSRVFPRSGGGGRVELVAGLSAAHHVLDGGGPAAAPAAEDETTSEDVAEAFGLPEDETVTLDYDLSGDDRPVVASWADVETSVPAPRCTCTLLDESRGGYRLAWREADETVGEVGELVVVRRLAGPGVQSPWEAGVIRWLKQDEEGGLQAGIEVFPGRVEAVRVRPSPEGGEPVADYLRCVLIHPAEAREPPVLCLPAFLYPGVQRVQVVQAGEVMDCRLTRRVELVGGFARMAFERLAGVPAEPEAGTDPQEGDFDFDNLFGS
jgi:hypothetical protein